MKCKMANLFFVLLCLFLLASCSTMNPKVKDGPPGYQVNVANIPNAVPRKLPRSRYGNPASYVALGKTYHVLPNSHNYNQRGIASWYGTKFNGQLTSSREPYDMLAMTAASPVLPLPTFAKVTNLENGRWVIVKVNDRGPFAPNRIIDLSYAAAKKLGYANKGTALVDVQAINFNQPQHYFAGNTRQIRQPQLYLQLGAFRDFANAQRLQTNARHYLQRQVEIISENEHNHTLYRVRIGPLKDVAESDNLFIDLKHHGFSKAITVIS